MKITIVKDSNEVGKAAGEIILKALKENNKLVLGLPTGDTPLTTYKYIIEDYKKNKTDWSSVKTFNLDEYVGLDENDKQSYIYYMQNNLFKHINLKKENTFIPLGKGDYLEYAKNYDKLIAQHGGIDIQLLSLGRNGHIAYNEPPADFNSETRLVKLVQNTIEANSRHFNSMDEVPREAISMGVKSIMNAKKIIVVAYGKNKAYAVQHMLEGKVDKNIPCTVLQKHKNVEYIIDKEAASLLKKKY